MKPRGGGACLIGAGTSSASITLILKSRPRNEDEATVYTHSSLNTYYNRTCACGAHRCIAPKFPTLSADRPWTCLGDLWIWYYIFLFSIPLTRYARYAPGGEIDTLFTRFSWRGWCTCRPQWDMPPPGMKLINFQEKTKLGHHHCKQSSWRNNVQRNQRCLVYVRFYCIPRRLINIYCSIIFDITPAQKISIGVHVKKKAVQHNVFF